TARELTDTESQLKALSLPERVYAVLPRTPRPIHVLARGDVQQLRERARPGTLSCLPGLEAEFETPPNEGQARAALANWIASPKNVLTWRSIVNRVWLY